MPIPANASAHQHGLTLVETIVALLLISSITIGIAALYAQRQNIARGGRLHDRAIELAQQMAASIRDNVDGKANFETTLGATCNTQSSKSGAQRKNLIGNNGNLVACWQDVVEQDLTNGSANISLDRATIPAQYIIVVSWSEPRNGTASYVLRVTPGSGKSAAATAIPADAAHAAG